MESVQILFTEQPLKRYHNGFSSYVLNKNSNSLSEGGVDLPSFVQKFDW